MDLYYFDPEDLWQSQNMVLYNHASKLEQIRQILRRHDGGDNLNPSIVRELFNTLIETPDDPRNYVVSVRDTERALHEIYCIDEDVLSAIQFLLFLYEIGEYLIGQDFCYWMGNKEDIQVSADQLQVRNLFADSKLRNANSFMKIFQKILLDGNLDFLVMLIKQGKCFEFPKDFKMVPDVVSVLANLRKPRNDRYDQIIAARRQFVISMLVRPSNINPGIIEEQNRSEHSSMEPGRNSIVELCINMLVKSLCNVPHTDRYSKCLQLAFEAAAEPVVSSHEVERYLRGLRFKEVSDGFINRVTTLYVEFMSENIHEPSPRSLKHLCRFQARKYLWKARSLPDEIPSLLLSKPLVKYLKLYLY